MSTAYVGTYDAFHGHCCSSSQHQHQQQQQYPRRAGGQGRIPCTRGIYAGNSGHVNLGKSYKRFSRYLSTVPHNQPSPPSRPSPRYSFGATPLYSSLPPPHRRHIALIHSAIFYSVSVTRSVTEYERPRCHGIADQNLVREVLVLLATLRLSLSRARVSFKKLSLERVLAASHARNARSSFFFNFNPRGKGEGKGAREKTRALISHTARTDSARIK